MKKVICVLLCLFFALTLYSCKNSASLKKLTNYNIEAVYNDETGILTSTMGVKFYNYTDAELTQLKFNLYGNAYREDSLYPPVPAAYHAAAYYNGNSWGSMTVTSVGGDSKNWEVGGKDKNILYVNLNKSLYPGDKTEITIDYTLALAKINHRLGITDNTVNLNNFFPILCAYDGGFYECEYYNDGDPFYSECSNFNVTLTVSTAYVLASSGSIKDCYENGSEMTYKLSIDRARDFAIVLSQDFNVQEAKVDETVVKYYYYDDEEHDLSMKAITDSLEYFSSTFGQYIYSTLSVVQTGFCFGGMEYPALTMISDTLLGNDLKYTIVHENAHQWWYAAVGNNQLENSWMDEGLAEYSTAMFYENHSDYGVTLAARVDKAKKSYKAYYSIYNQIFGETDTSMNRKLGEYISSYEYTNIAYFKGMLMFDYLRKSIGDQKFMSGLKTYYSKYKYKIASPEDMAGCFERTGVDISGFFSSFIDGKVII